MLHINCYICVYLSTANGSVRGSSSSEASSNQSTGYTELTSSHESVSVTDWTPSHVAEWLQRMSLQRYCDLFIGQRVNGETLLQLDSTKMKVRDFYMVTQKHSAVRFIHCDSKLKPTFCYLSQAGYVFIAVCLCQSVRLSVCLSVFVSAKYLKQF